MGHRMPVTDPVAVHLRLPHQRVRADYYRVLRLAVLRQNSTVKHDAVAAYPCAVLIRAAADNIRKL